MNNENVDAVLPQPEQEEYTLEEIMVILDLPLGAAPRPLSLP
jgi:hypothetical protein